MLPSLFTIVSALLLTLSFPPWGFYPLIFVALVPWFIALDRTRSSREAFIQGVWLSFFFSLFAFFWVASVLHEFANLPWPVAGLGLILYGLIGQPQFYFFAPIWRWLHSKLPHPLIGAATFAFLYSGIDWFTPKLFVDTLGHSLHTAERLRQAADLGGATLLTFFIYWFNDLFWRIWTQRRWQLHAVLALVFTIALLTYGELRKNQIRSIMNSAKNSVQAAVIQANIGDFDKIAAETGLRDAADRILRKFFSMSDEALKLTPKPDVLIWPETSYPSTFRTPETISELGHDEEVEHYVKDRNVALAFGGYDHMNSKDYNAFFFLSPRVQPEFPSPGDLQIYRKNILLLFGEYIPGSETFTFLKTAFPQVGNFGRGVGPDVLRIVNADPKKQDVRVGPIICYEALFPNYIIAAANKGSQLILNITNDSWFGPLGEPVLHYSLVKFRSIETRLPQLRATNTGISALILPDGSVEQETKVGSETIMNVRIPLTDPIPTLMKKWGDWFGPFALGAGLLLLLVQIVLARKFLRDQS